MDIFDSVLFLLRKNFNIKKRENPSWWTIQAKILCIYDLSTKNHKVVTCLIHGDWNFVLRIQKKAKNQFNFVSELTDNHYWVGKLLCNF